MCKMDIKYEYCKSSEEGQMGKPFCGRTPRAGGILGGKVKTEGGME